MNNINANNWKQVLDDVLTSSSTHRIVKDTLNSFMEKDALDAMYDSELIAAILKARIDDICKH